MSVPTVEEVAAVLGKPAAAVASVYAAEVADQASRCRTDPYSAALSAALVRRVQRALALGNHPLGLVVSTDGTSYVGSADPEVRRLEAPHRKVVLG